METLPPQQQPIHSSRGPVRQIRKAPAANVHQKSFTEKTGAHPEIMEPNVNFDLVLPDKVVDKIMGPDPVPIIDIEINEI